MVDKCTAPGVTSHVDRERAEVVIKVPNVLGWVPDEFFDHMRTSWREQLLAMRCLLDAAIERTEEPKARPNRSRLDITVE